ncbi:amidohydrolase, partial [Marimonas sp. MJW-29]
AYAKVRYVVRAGTAPEMLELLEGVRKVGTGAAMMTETTLSHQILAAVSNLIYTEPLGEAMHNNLERLGPPPFSEVDLA